MTLGYVMKPFLCLKKKRREEEREGGEEEEKGWGSGKGSERNSGILPGNWKWYRVSFRL